MKRIIILSLLFYSSIARLNIHIIERQHDVMAIITGHEAHILMALLENTDFHQDGEIYGHISCSLIHERCTIGILKNKKAVRHRANYLCANIGKHKRLSYVLERHKRLSFDNYKIIFELGENECNIAIRKNKSD